MSSRLAMHGHVAFASPAAPALRLTSRRAVTCAPLQQRRLPQRALRFAARMAAEDEAPASARPTATAPEDDDEGNRFAAPSFDTTVFSDFVGNAQAKLDELQTQIAEIDSEAVVEDAKTASIGLVDNLIAGDWLNRGELYGAVQVLFAILLLRSPGFLDGLVGFVVGPATLFTGAAIAVKALFDLGRKQLSIWPAPVPGAELKTEGLYNVVRHPLYSGLLLSTFGYAAATGSPERIALAVAFAFFVAKKISIEEDYLVDTYADYTSYQQDVPYKLIPRVF